MERCGSGIGDKAVLALQRHPDGVADQRAEMADQLAEAKDRQTILAPSGCALGLGGR